MELLIYLIIFTCCFGRCIMFKNRDVKWWIALIPGVNKYFLGKMSGSKKLGIINGIIIPLWYAGLIGIYQFEVWIIQNYYYQAQVDDYLNGRILVIVPENIKNWIIFLKYAMIVLSVLTVVVWSWMMLKFSQLHKKSNWWIILWAVCPAIGYAYFAFYDLISIDGKLYTLKKVPYNASKKK